MTEKASPGDWVKHGEGDGGIERIEAFFEGHGYAPHRHDTYAIGFTLAGVQSFQYQRSRRHGVPGSVLVLHPDELHDGEAGTAAGFRYRMAYVSPWQVQQVLGGAPLPFVQGGVSSDPRLRAAILPLLAHLQACLDPLEEADALYDLSHSLVAVAGRPRAMRRPDAAGVGRARAYLMDRLGQQVTLDELEQVSDMDRWQLSRDFRALLGTSPYRFLTLRRLDRVRRALLAGQSIASAALDTGFFDQSHMARQFLPAYGVTPALWLKRMGMRGRRR